MKRLIVVVVALAALVLPVSTVASYQDQKLNAVASIFAQRPVQVVCMAADETDSPATLNAWGYVNTPLAKQHQEFLDAQLCESATSVNDTSILPYFRALGVSVLVHESYHLRRWGGAGNEGAVECKAIRHWRVAAQVLGATPATLTELWPWALAQYYEEANLTTIYGDRPYRDDDCHVPDLNQEES